MRLALICPDMTGHSNPLLMLGQALAARGHTPVVFGYPGLVAKAAAAGLAFRPIGAAVHRSGADAADGERLAKSSARMAMVWTARLLKREVEVHLAELPDALREASVEAVICDQIAPAAATAADLLNLPCGVAACALPGHIERGVPPVTTGWDDRRSLWNAVRNGLGNAAFVPTVAALYRPIFHFRRARKLPRLTNVTRQSHGLVQVAQCPAFFDFARNSLPRHFHYTGPWLRPTEAAATATLPATADGPPLVYASLGTMQNGRLRMFQAILDAAESLSVRLVLSLGGSTAGAGLRVPANAVVMPYAPQLELLSRAAAVVTHAGLNTTLETLRCGKPMVCLPIANDQPGVAARVAKLRVGIVVPASRASTMTIRDAVQAVSSDPAFRLAAEACAAKLRSGPGVDAAASLLERAFETKRPVYRTA